MLLKLNKRYDGPMKMQRTILDDLLNKIFEKFRLTEGSTKHDDEWGLLLGKKQLWDLRKDELFLDCIDIYPNKYGAYAQLYSVWLFYSDEKEEVKLDIKPVSEIMRIRDIKPCHR